MTDKRGIYVYEDKEDRYCSGTMTVTATHLGLNVEIDQEHAVDSYNQDFISTVFIPNAEVRNFLGFLGQFDWSEAADEVEQAR